MFSLVCASRLIRFEPSAGCYVDYTRACYARTLQGACAYVLEVDGFIPGLP